MRIEKTDYPEMPSTATKLMPVLFLGHGSPMNAIEDNEFTKGFEELALSLPKPKAVLCISAHWESDGVFVTAMEIPRTIHDFYGFPKELFDVQYPAPGSPEIAELVKDTIKSVDVNLDYEWVLDHGCWSVLKFLYPDADVPIVQLSLNRSEEALWHYEFAKELSFLREKNIMIIGSGNIVHNLGVIDWNKKDSGFDWAEEANKKMIKFILENEYEKLINYNESGIEFKKAIPTPEHFLPLLYILSLKKDYEKINVFNNKLVYGSLSMASFRIG